MLSRGVATVSAAVTGASITAEIIIVAVGRRGPARRVKIRHLTDVLRCNFQHNFQTGMLPGEDRLQPAPYVS